MEFAMGCVKCILCFELWGKHQQDDVSVNYNCGGVSKEKTSGGEGQTDYLKEVGEQDDLLGGLCSVGPVAEQRPRQEATQAESRQGQTQEVRRCI